MVKTLNKEIIASKSLINFYKDCYERLGFKLDDIKKIERNYTMFFSKKIIDIENIDEFMNLTNTTEKKLQIIELTTRKKCGFRNLSLNLTIHICLFCIQAFIFSYLNINSTHPKTMLEIGMILFLIILLVGFAIKLVELFRWNKIINNLKKEVLNIEYKNEIFKETKIISVLFTRNHGWLSELIYWTTGRQYTHASIGIDEKNDTFYSYDARGFRIEHPGHRKIINNQKESLCYQFKVNKSEYNVVKEIIQKQLDNKDNRKYNYIGALLGVIHIYVPVKSSKVFFCSEFVTETLQKTGAFTLKKVAGMYLPTNLAKALIMQNNIYKVFVNEI